MSPAEGYELGERMLSTMILSQLHKTQMISHKHKKMKALPVLVRLTKIVPMM